MMPNVILLLMYFFRIDINTSSTLTNFQYHKIINVTSHFQKNNYCIISPVHNLDSFLEWKESINNLIINDRIKYINPPGSENNIPLNKIEIEKCWIKHQYEDELSYVLSEKLGRDGDRESWTILLESLSKNPTNKTIQSSVFLAMDSVLLSNDNDMNNFIEIFKKHSVIEVRYAAGIALSRQFLGGDEYSLKIDNELLLWLSKTDNIEIAKRIISNRFGAVSTSSNFGEKLKIMSFNNPELKQISIDLIKGNTPIIYETY